MNIQRPHYPEISKERAAVAACMILNPHYESFGKAFQDDVQRATKYILDAIDEHARESVNELLDAAKHVVREWEYKNFSCHPMPELCIVQLVLGAALLLLGLNKASKGGEPK